MKRMIVGAMFFLSIAVPAHAQTESDHWESAPEDEQPADAAITVYVDVMPVCPRRGCWAVTSEALSRLDGIKQVDFDPAKSNLQRVYMTETGLPDPQAWESKFRKYVDTASEFRGVVVTLTGTIAERDGQLTITAQGVDPVKLRLCHHNLKWSNVSTAAPSEHDEPVIRATTTETNTSHTRSDTAKITGLLAKDKNGFSVDVQQFELVRVR